MELLNSLKTLIFTILLLLTLTLVKGAIITSTASGGDWGSTTTWVGSILPSSTDFIIINTTGSGRVTSATGTTTITCAGLTINSGAILTMYRPFTINGTTSITGTINFGSNNSSTRLMTFNGIVTLNIGAVWNETAIGAIPTFNFTNCFINNSTSFITQAGSHTFSGTAMTISGTTVTSISNVVINGTYTNNGTLSILTALTGGEENGELTNGAIGVLNIGGTSTISSLIATAVGNIIKYTGAAQTVKPITYDRLTLSGSGVKTTSNVTVNAIFSIEGTATVSVAPTYGASATLQYNTAIARTAGVEWKTSFAASGGVVIANTGTITINTAKVFNVSVPLNINIAATLATNNMQLTFGGDFINNGTLTAGSSSIVIANTATTQNISGFTTTGIVSMTKTAGTAFFTGNVNGAGLTINGKGATLNLGNGLTHTFTDTWISSAGTLNGGSSTLRLGGGYIGTNGIFTAATGTVEYYASAIQTIALQTYNNLTLSGTSTKTFPTGTTTVNGTLSREGTTSIALTGLLTYGANSTLQYKGSIAQTTDVEFPATWSSSGGVKIENANGVTLNAARNIGSNPFTIGSLVPNSAFNDGGYQLTANGTLNLISGTFKLGAANATTFPDFEVNNIIAGTTVEYAATTAQTVRGITYSNLIISGTGLNSKTVDANLTVNGILNLNSINASATQGCLETGTFILIMGADANTTGTGDVTGIVQRNSFVENTLYTFGSQFTTLSFIPRGTLPVSVSFKIVLTASHDWKSDAIHRYYDIKQTGGDLSTKVTLNLHYLHTELNGAKEGNLDLWEYHIVELSLEDHGQSNFNTTDNWVGLSNLSLTYIAPESSFGAKYWTLDNSEAAGFTWIGASNDWMSTSNWVGGIVPASADHIIIPDASTTLNDPILPINTTIGSINIQSGGILNGGTGTMLTLSGGAGAWDNQGTFNPGTSTIVFTSPIATMTNTTNFYNVTVADGATLTLGTDNTMRISGSLSLSSSGILNATDNHNTVEYNGTFDQSIINPNGLSLGYYNLILSGSGTKKIPLTALLIIGDFTILGTCTATVDGMTTVGGNLTIGNGTSLFISPAINLTVLGTLNNNAGTSCFVLQSDITGTASLFHNTNNVAATVECYFPGNVEACHFLSSPVTTQGFSDSWLPSGTYANGTGYDLYLWDEPTSCWIYKLDSTSIVNWNTVHPGNDFIVGRGYLYSVQASNPTNSFVGNLNNGPVNYKLTYSSNIANLKGFNLLGNPYPSPIDWAATSGWSRSNLVSSGGGYNMWIWNPEANNYGVYNSADEDSEGTNSVTRYIATMQGYFVQAYSSGYLSINNNVRVLDGTGNGFKRKKQEESKVSFSVKSDAGNGSDEIQLRFGYSENQNGAMKLFSKTLLAPSLYLGTKENPLSVRYLTNTEENPTIPFLFNPGMNSNYTINCNFDQTKFDTLMLEDRQTHYVQNMRTEKTYSFQGSLSDDPNRFVLYFRSVKNHPGKELPARIYIGDNRLIIDLTLISNETDIFVYDIMGRKLLHQKLNGETLHNLNIDAHTQLLIVYLKNQDRSLCRKLLWVEK